MFRPLKRFHQTKILFLLIELYMFGEVGNMNANVGYNYALKRKVEM